VAILKDGRLVREGTVDDLTQARSAYEIMVRALKPEIVPALRAAVPDVRLKENRLEAATDEEGLNRLIDALRERGVVITGVLPGRESLEEVFVKVIGEEDS
jgi:ABC-type multidrug transport system ATPase subunit